MNSFSHQALQLLRGRSQLPFRLSSVLEWSCFHPFLILVIITSAFLHWFPFLAFSVVCCQGWWADEIRWGACQGGVSWMKLFNITKLYYFSNATWWKKLHILSHSKWMMRCRHYFFHISLDFLSPFSLGTLHISYCRLSLLTLLIFHLLLVL